MTQSECNPPSPLKLSRAIGAGVLSMLLAGCSTAYMSFARDALLAPPEMTVVDVGEKRLEIFSVDTGPNPQQAIFFVSGSGCASLRYFLRSYFEGLEGSWRIHSVQKEGVGGLETGGNCSDAFRASYNYDILLERNAAALEWVKSRSPNSVSAIVGVSEGGTIAAALAAENPEIDRLVVIGSGGLSLRQMTQILAERQGRPEELAAGLAAVDADPANLGRDFMGMPHPYLASVLDVDPLPIFARVTQPTMLIIGEEDESVPVESARYLARSLEEYGKSNVTLTVIPGADHTLRRDGQDLKPALMARLSRWLGGGAWQGM